MGDDEDPSCGGLDHLLIFKAIIYLFRFLIQFRMLQIKIFLKVSLPREIYLSSRFFELI